jgi:lysine decarboxylase
VLTVTVMDDPAFIAAFAETLVDLVEAHRGDPRPPSPAAVWTVRPEVVLTPREAFYGRRRRVRMADAVGQVSAEQFCPYPPGVPLLAPGEGITAETIDAIRIAATMGRVAYCSDPTLETIEIVELTD